MVDKQPPKMNKVIRIDEEVWEYLQSKATEYGMQFAIPNDVLRKVLGMPPRIK